MLIDVTHTGGEGYVAWPLIDPGSYPGILVVRAPSPLDYEGEVLPMVGDRLYLVKPSGTSGRCGTEWQAWLFELADPPLEFTLFRDLVENTWMVRIVPAPDTLGPVQAPVTVWMGVSVRIPDYNPEGGMPEPPSAWERLEE